MKKLLNYIISTLLLLSLCNCTNQKTMVNNQTVKQLEIEKFLGQWYEIARFPHSFEKNLVGVTANYSINNDGKIKVINQGYKDSLHGKIKTAVGKAKIPNPELPGNLKVSFFWIFYSDYLVMELDSIDYQWAVIGSSSPDYLWILSRTPQMDEDIYQNLIQKIKKRGYDLSKIIRVEQAQSN